ncbi:MAG: class I SAM-dependent methyltransferase [Candidatus Neomarinimicrobiota bacterium]
MHFAPEEVLKNEISKMNHLEYFTTDIEMNNVDFPKEDIQQLSFSNETFDYIFINHVLEHVKDDEKAIAELSRILNKDGVAIITIPGDWKRRYTKIFKKINYNGHYRDYGLDVVNKFYKHFEIVKSVNLFKYNGKKYAIKKYELAFVCIK